MSQIVTRKGPIGEDKDKGQSTDTPVKEMKKKMAANAEKEKQAAEKHADKDKEKEKEKDKDKPTEKQPEKAEKSVDKSSEKTSEKKEKPDKSTDKKEKHAEKEKAEKSAEKKNEAPAEKPKEDKNAKQPEKPDDKDKENKEKDKKRTDTPKPKQNGQPTANGDHSDATVSDDDELVIIDHERDDMFPELAYEDSDGEFEPPTPEGLPSRSYTRRSQAKAARTPETPRPASDKRADKDADDSKDSKVLKLKEDAPSTDRKLRSADSPKPEAKAKSQEKKQEPGKEAEKTSPKKKDLEVPPPKDDEGHGDKSAVEIVIDVDVDEGAARKDGTNYSRSRVKVSPYRRAADQTASSVAANYTGNNTTMEMDITETSSLAEEAPADSPYLSGLRSIRGRRSYKPLKEMALRNISVSRSLRSTTSVVVSEQPSRPTAPVVGRKRKPEGDDCAELASAAQEAVASGKRARLLEKLARPFRHAASTPLPVRRNAEIVGINTDLPLTAPVAAPDTFDPETLKSSDPATPSPPALGPRPQQDRDGKRCSIM